MKDNTINTTKIIDDAWNSYKNACNLITLLESIGLIVEDEKKSRLSGEPVAKMCDLYAIQTSSADIIAAAYDITSEEKIEALTQILEDGISNFFDYDVIPDEVHNEIIDLKK